MPEPHFASQRWWEKCVMCISIRSFDELFRRIERPQQMSAGKRGSKSYRIYWDQFSFHVRWSLCCCDCWISWHFLFCLIWLNAVFHQSLNSVILANPIVMTNVFWLFLPRSKLWGSELWAAPRKNPSLALMNHTSLESFLQTSLSALLSADCTLAQSC